jgi:Flp pilus assembly protein TadD
MQKLPWPLLISLTLLSIFLPGIAYSESPTALATLFSLEGSATVVHRGQVESSPLSVGAALVAGDTIKTDAQSRAGIKFSDGGFVRLGNQAVLVLKAQAEQTALNLEQGDAYFFSRSPKKYPEINTPTVSAAIRGTEFNIRASNVLTTVAVIEGQVELFNAFGKETLAGGEGALVKLGEAPSKQLLVNLPNTVQWTIQVPFIGCWNDYRDRSANESDFNKLLDALNHGTTYKPTSDWAKTFLRASDLIQRQQFNQALLEIGLEPKEPALKLLAGRLALYVGTIEQGEKLLEQLVDTNSELATSARATLSMLEVSRGDLPAAQRVLEPATTHDTKNYSSLLALALLAQAKRNLTSTADYLSQASELEPNSNFLKIRRAELALAEGELDQAEELLRGWDSRYDTGYGYAIGGFIHLARGERELAGNDFEAAKQSSSSNSLASLGSALLQTSLGNQERGIELFQQAAILDPNNSMLRSYLGKSFSEANREVSAENEYAQAMKLDPQDPTPWIYRSYSRIAQNRPVAALDDIEESIDRNQNRAVYRSSFLLDQDSAVRSANLARVFNELGFSDAGRIEAIKSINKQYSNFSAHRLLADTQNTIFLADASFSERRISDLMAPLSLNLFDSASGSVTLNEYSALFERDQTRFAFGGDISSFDDLYAPSLLVAGKDGRLGYSFSATTINRDGSAQNNSNQDYRISSMLQYQPTWRDRVSVSTLGQFVRTRDSNAYEQEVDLRCFGVDLGYLHTFAPGILGIASSSFQRGFDNAHQFGANEQLISTQIVDGQEDSILSEILADRSRDSYLTSVLNQAQLIFDGSLVSSVVGASHNRLLSDRFDDATVVEDDLGELTGLGVKLPSSQENQLTTYSVYNYHTLHATSWIDLTAGASYEETQRDLREVPPFVNGNDPNHRFAPKLGAVINPISNLTLRSSYGEGVRKAVLEDQISIEPTMVGGINQRFNDLSGSENRQFGIGADWKSPKSTYLGTEWIRRHINEPISFTTNQFTANFDTDTSSSDVQFNGTSHYHVEQDFLRSYLSQVLSDRFVMSFDHRYAMQRFTDQESYERLEEHRASATVKYFDPSGLILFSRALWIYQERIGSINVSDGTEPFWQFDTGAGYRLPGRKGIIRLELRNLLDQSFELDQTAGFYEVLAPSRSVFLTARFNY